MAFRTEVHHPIYEFLNDLEMVALKHSGIDYGLCATYVSPGVGRDAGGGPNIQANAVALVTALSASRHRRRREASVLGDKNLIRTRSTHTTRRTVDYPVLSL